MKRFKKKIGLLHKRLTIALAYAGRLSVKKSPHKKIIICFDGLFPHGGFVDRLKGIVSLYEVSKLLGYEFYIQFDNPFHLPVFLKPNKVSWDIAKTDLSWTPLKTKFLYLMNDFEANPLEIIKQSKATTFIVYTNIDYLPKLYTQWSPSQIEEKWANNFNELFQKSDYLKKELATLGNKKYIGIHTRFTSLMGDFRDTTKKVLSEEQKQALLQQLESKIAEIVKQAYYDSYVFSDSMIFLQFISKNQKVHIVGGTPKHMDNFNEETSLENHLKTILDFFLMANSEVIYFLRVAPMYHSSFSKYAAIVGNKPFKTILN
ncbi:MAG: hypothetical protein R2781_04350 [Flavobacteriaceae bacterium]